MFAFGLLPSKPAVAQSISFVRDAEIEQLLKDYAAPVFRASGINADATRIILVGSREFNAFVASGRKVFVNVGVIMESATPNQVIGVLAHEAGHIAGGHLFRLREELARAQILAIAGTILGAGAAVGSARSGGVSADGVAPTGLILSGAEFARRTLLSYQRSEEQAADKAALRYLNQSGQSAKGMIETFERFASDSLFRRAGSDPYLQSHPSAPERISALKEEAAKSPHFNKPDSAALKTRHELAKGKLIGFLTRPEELSRRYQPSDNSMPARYARAISAYRFSSPAAAQVQIDGLIRTQPNNAYFWELKGQAHLETGRPREAAVALRRAVQLAPGQPLIRGMLGHALVSTGDKKDAEVAVRELTTASQRDPETPEYFEHMARAHGTLGNEGLAALASAQALVLNGKQDDARRLARRAQALVPAKSAAWQRADEIIHQPSQR
jgi:predicted Zn-dependent protease